VNTRLVLDALGDGNAENELNFDRVFIETEDYREVVEGARSLILGGRGAGKSAIFRMLASRASTARNEATPTLVLTLEADQGSWRDLERAADQERDDVAAISRQWELAVLLHSFEAVVAAFPTQAKRRRLVRDLNAEVDKVLDRDLLRESPDGRLSMILSAAAEILGQLPFKFKIEAPFVPLSIELRDDNEQRKSPTRSELERRGIVLIQSMYGVLESLMTEVVDGHKRRIAQVHILMDQLDEYWRGRPHQVASLCGLITAVERVTQTITQRGLAGMLSFSVFLRSDIYDHLKRHGLTDASKYRRHELQLRWDEAALRALLDRRVEAAGVPGLSGFSNLFAPEKMSTKSLDSYLLATAVPRPRDVIQFLAMCLDNAVTRRSDVLSRDDVRSAEATYSGWRRDVILEEARTSHSYADGLLESFTSGTPTFDDQALTKHLEAVKRENEIRPTKPALRNALFDWGVLGVRVASGRTRFAWDVPPGTYPQPGSGGSDGAGAPAGELWVVHPSLWQVLDIRPSPRRTKQPQ
jgi:hypothetical protein